jgi:hypothetical protein
MDALSRGNAGIDGGPMRIQKPEAAAVLLELAIQCYKDKQRALFFHGRKSVPLGKTPLADRLGDATMGFDC